MKTRKETSGAFVELPDDVLDNVIGGVMVVNHNAAEINTLTQSEISLESSSKSLGKLSTGLKINSSSDDPSGYQISERMRVP